MKPIEMLSEYIKTDVQALDHSVDDLLLFFHGELGEFWESVIMVELGADPMEVAQEGADVLFYGVYLLMKDAVTPEIEQAVIDVLEVFATGGIDWVQAMLMKAHRNAMKHRVDTPYSMNGHSKRDVFKSNKMFWKDGNFDRAFYESYTNQGDLLYEEK
jgi:hypothetical protein